MALPDPLRHFEICELKKETAMSRVLALLLCALMLFAASAAPSWAAPPVYKTCWNGSVIKWAQACPKPPKGVPATKPPTPVPAPTPAPVVVPPAPAPSPTPGPATVVAGEPDPIPPNFDPAPLLVPAWGTGRPALPATNDTVGAFRFICGAGQIAYDDPIVYPGQPGKSHLHQFFGNTLANASSTYQSLRTSGDSTCNNMLNRSAYWMPAMLDGKGHVVRPDWLQVYYKRFPQGAPECTFKGKACVNLPRGLRYIFGYDMIDMTDALADAAKYWTCQGGTAPDGVHVANLTELIAACPGGTQVGAGVSAPNCWDGVNLDSPNHRSHVVYQALDNNYGQWRCPADHPYILPAFSLSAWFTVPTNIATDVGTWSLSSDAMMPGVAPGTTLHSDWFGAWDDATLATWEANCIDKKLSCAGGDLGNGTQMAMINGQSGVANPRLVPVP